MASLEKLVVDLRQRKNQASKLRLKAEKQLKEVKSLERRSSSGLVSLDKKIESEREDSSDFSEIITQKSSQLESIKRLVTAAEERLEREKEALTETEQQIEFAESPEEKQFAQARLNLINGHIEELKFEIKSREKTAKKIAEELEKNTEEKSKISSKIKKQSQSKPGLKQTMISSHKDAEKLAKELEKLQKSEESAKKSLEKALTKLKDQQAKKRTPSPKKASKHS